jgi:hypothetical protein
MRYCRALLDTGTLDERGRGRLDCAVGRRGSNPSDDGARVSASIIPYTSETLQYGDDENPYMNALSFSAAEQDMKADVSLRAIERGGPGTLDALFNTNSIVTVGSAWGSSPLSAVWSPIWKGAYSSVHSSRLCASPSP